MSQPADPTDISRAHFRANPEYELVQFEHLPDPYRTQFAGLQADPDFYGVLWPHAAGLVLKAVDKETALLFLSLQKPGPIPAYVRAGFGERTNQAIAQLVLDGVLEMALELTGPFASGAAAYPLIYEAKASPPEGGRIAQLSMAALEYGQALEIASSGELSARLYTYNTVPLSFSWRKRIPAPDAVPGFLGVDTKGRHRRVLDRYYRPQPVAANGAGWRVWNLVREQAARQETWVASHKLYISPRPEVLPEISGVIVEVLGTSGVRTFKIGRDLHGLLRPDKMVAYCGSFEELAALAARLQKILGGCPSQGVPFTASVDPEGLLSWGTDPPAEAQQFAGLEPESWRLWVTNRLAVALLAAKTQSASIKPVAFALERLRMDGVNTDTWTPRQAIWQSARRD